MTSRWLTRTVLATSAASTLMVGLVAGPARADDVPEPGPADELLVEVESFGLLVDLAVGADGSMYRQVREQPSGFRRIAPLPLRGYEVTQLSDEGLERLMDEVERLGLLDEDIDPGPPSEPVPDGVDADITIADGDETRHHVWRTGSEGDGTDELREFMELVWNPDALESVIGAENIGDWHSYVPEQWIVRRAGGWVTGIERPRPWPLTAPPRDHSCVVLASDAERDTATAEYRGADDVVWQVRAALPWECDPNGELVDPARPTAPTTTTDPD